jgi:hypothetical protein
MVTPGSVADPTVALGTVTPTPPVLSDALGSGSLTVLVVPGSDAVSEGNVTPTPPVDSAAPPLGPPMLTPPGLRAASELPDAACWVKGADGTEIAPALGRETMMGAGTEL